ncbi:hypothetical protein CVE26_11255, partial [Pseudomonas syringae pv. actinidiae]|nr:hypothetical protein [Pseudomonas syringae pv. actinidiae]
YRDGTGDAVTRSATQRTQSVQNGMRRGASHDSRMVVPDVPVITHWNVGASLLAKRPVRSLE